MRSISDRQGLTLKAATRRSVDMAGGGDAFQHVTRVKAGAISKYGTAGDDNADKFMPIDIAVEADLEANSPIIVSAMAELLGYQLVPMDGAPLRNATKISVMDALRIATSAGDVVKGITQALDDGEIDGLERKQITRELDEAIAAFKCVLRRIGGAA